MVRGRFMRSPGRLGLNALRCVVAGTLVAALGISMGCGREKGAADRADLPQLGEAEPVGWLRGVLPAVHVSLDALPWLGAGVAPAQRPDGGLAVPFDAAEEVGEAEVHPGRGPRSAPEVEHRVAIRLAGSLPAWRLMASLGGVSRIATLGDVWIACRNASDEPGWVRLPMLGLAEESTLSWEAVPPGEESPGARLDLLPSTEAIARLLDRDRRVPEQDVWTRVGRLVPIGATNLRIVRVWLHPSLPLQQVLVTLRKLEAASGASLVVTVGD